MADKVKEEDPVTPPTDAAPKVSDNPVGKVTEDVRKEVREEQKSTGPQTVEEQFKDFAQNIAKLGVDKRGKFDVPPGLYDDRLAHSSGPKTVNERGATTFGADVLPAAGSKTQPLDGRKGEAQPTAEQTMARNLDAVRAPKNSAEVLNQAARLGDHSRNPANRLTEAQQKDLQDSTDRLINNKNSDGSPRHPPLSAAEVEKVLKQANRMFDETAQIEANGFSKSARNYNVTAMVHDIARPEHADQGKNDTCASNGVTKVELFLSPGAQAEKNVDMWANKDNKDDKGMFVKMGDQKVYYDPQSIVADGEAKYASDNRGSIYRDPYMRAITHLYNNSETQKRGEFFVEGRITDKKEDFVAPKLLKDSFHGEPVTEKVKDAATGVTKEQPVTNPLFYATNIQSLMDKLNIGSLAMNSASTGVRPSERGNMIEVSGAPGSLDKAWLANGSKPMPLFVDCRSAMFRDAAGVGGKSEGGGHLVMVSEQRTNAQGQKEYLLHNWGEQNGGWVNGDALASSMNPNGNGGDRSGAVPIASGAFDPNISFHDRMLTRPQPRPAQGENGNGESEGAPKRSDDVRDRGLLVNKEAEAESARRTERQQELDNKNKDRTDQKQKELDQERVAAAERKQQDELSTLRQQDLLKKQKDEEAKRLLTKNKKNGPTQA